jgi:hypothetical protein
LQEERVEKGGVPLVLTEFGDEPTFRIDLKRG